MMTVAGDFILEGDLNLPLNLSLFSGPLLVRGCVNLSGNLILSGPLPPSSLTLPIIQVPSACLHGNFSSVILLEDKSRCHSKAVINHKRTMVEVIVTLEEQLTTTCLSHASPRSLMGIWFMVFISATLSSTQTDSTLTTCIQ